MGLCIGVVDMASGSAIMVAAALLKFVGMKSGKMIITMSFSMSAQGRCAHISIQRPTFQHEVAHEVSTSTKFSVHEGDRLRHDLGYGVKGLFHWEF